MNVWLLDEGTQGHTVQTKGIGELLQAEVGAEIEWISCRLKLRGWIRPLVRFLVGKASAVLALSLAKMLYPGLRIPAGAPDLVISSCGKSAYLNRLLCSRFGARGIFVGERKPFPAEWFDLILTPVSDGSENELLMPIMETGQSAAAVRAAMGLYWPSGGPSGCWVMLIGGASRTHPFQEKDWAELGEAMNLLAEKQGIKWLVSTSRRTGGEAEAILKEALDFGRIEEVVWWADEPKRCMGAFLGAGERIFVTQDSLSMMSEGLAAGKRVELVLPRAWDMPEESFNGRYVRRLEKDGLVGRTQILDLAVYEVSGDGRVDIGGMREDFAKRLLSWVLAERVGE